MRRKRYFKRRHIVQRHHLSYDPEVVFRMWSEEHYYISLLDRFKPPFSLGFIKSLRYFLLRNDHRAVDLDKRFRKKNRKDIKALKKLVKRKDKRKK